MPVATIALSVVVPCMNEADGLPEFCRRTLAACAENATDGFELILVDDGSTDATWAVIERLAGAQDTIIGVRLLRNHGHQLAATAGLAISRGERVMLIDADLQDPPELLASMMRLMDGGADVVYGLRRARRGETLLKRLSAAVFYRLLSQLASVPIPHDTGDFRLMSRRVVDILVMMPEHKRFIRGMVSWIGGRQVPLEYDRDARFAGETKYPVRAMLRFAADAITSFSVVPLRIGIWLGLLSATVAIGLMVFTLVQLSRGLVIAGWSSLMMTVAAFSAVQLIILGVIGEYIGRLAQETKHRPLFMIDIIQHRGQCLALPVEFHTWTAKRRRRALAPAAGAVTGDRQYTTGSATSHHADDD